jgi:hypothetical protein
LFCLTIITNFDEATFSQHRGDKWFTGEDCELFWSAEATQLRILERGLRNSKFEIGFFI